MRALLLALVFTQALVPSALASPLTFQKGGRWFSKDIGVPGTHLVLLRDGQDDSSKVFLFGGSGTKQLMKLWTFMPSDSLSIADTASATRNTTVVPHPVAGRLDLFCGGHATMPDGRMLYIGGEWFSPVGLESTFVFDPRYPSASYTSPWSFGATMASERWYPTLTTLANGKLLATAGNRHTGVAYSGGSNGSPSDTLHPLSMAGRAIWGNVTISSSSRPAAREDHTLTGDRIQRAILFGGKSGTTYFNDVWLLQRNNDDSTHNWTQLTVHDDATYGHPAARANHTMIWLGDAKKGQTIGADSLYLLLYGGIDNSGHVYGDVWFGWRTPGTNDWYWDRMWADDSAFARYGHTAVYDPGPLATGTTLARMLVFGGKNSGGAFRPNDVLAFGFYGGLRRWWTLVSSGTSGVPPARFEHAGVMEVRSRSVSNNTVRRMAVFGGEGASLMNDVWTLSRGDGNASDTTTYAWAQMATNTGPSPRYRMSAVHHDQPDRLVVFGGDSTGSASGGLTNEIWYLALADGIPQEDRWSKPTMRDFPNLPDPLPTAGHAGFVEPEPTTQPYPETFDPSGTSGSLVGTWTTAASGAQPQALYPFMFGLPNGKLFYGGPPFEHSIGSAYQILFDPSAGTWAADTMGDWYDASSAVMYRPGRLLRCGRHSDGDVNPGVEYTDTLIVSGSTVGRWQPIGDPPTSSKLKPRANSNLTMLPTGDPIVTGGLVGTVFTEPQREPQFWRVATGSWSDPTNGDSLRGDPKVRNYHSSAILLPDARVLTAGGENVNNNDRFSVSVYEPPYLFRNNYEYAPRPAIGQTPTSVTWGQLFTICTSRASSIVNAALIRPGAATHGFDQNQRYVPLSFTSASSPSRLHITMPADGNLAPPGDYMLFLIDNVATDAPTVPSIARWVRVGSTAGLDSCDTQKPGPCLNFTGEVAEDGFTATLSWTAPADDGALASSGKATSYELRYKHSISAPGSDTLAWFNNLLTASPPTPSTVGTQESKTFSLLADKLYYFALRAVDDNTNKSYFQIITLETWYQDGFGAGGGGGGSLIANSALAGETASTATAALSEGNSMFEGAPSGEASTDLLRLGSAPTGLDGLDHLWFRVARGRGAHVDQAGLLLADHAPEVSAYAVDGAVVFGVPTAVPVARLGDSTDVTARLAAGGEGIALVAGQWVTLDLRDAAGSPRTLLLTAARGAPPRDRSEDGLLIEALDPRGVWAPLTHLFPRHRRSDLTLAGVTASQLRMRILNDLTLHFAGTIAGSNQAGSVQPAALTRATNGDVADARTELSAEGGAELAVTGPDTLDLAFTSPAVPAGLVRDYFLSVRATQDAPRLPGTMRQVAVLPAAFALHQNIPNPFTGETAIGFDLPVAASVTLEIFDPQGRRVRRLGGRFEAGRRSVVWDERNSEGGRVAPGIYVYRMTAGAFREERKMVLLP